MTDRLDEHEPWESKGGVMSVPRDQVRGFLMESNRIEGIVGAREAEVDAALEFLGLPQIAIDDLVQIVGVFQPDAKLRSRKGLNVRVGTHVAPSGGPQIVSELEDLLADAYDIPVPYQTHHRYETLHPFTDGNGRSGRMLWLWQMVRLHCEIPPLGFLHTWYYQSLEVGR